MADAVNNKFDLIIDIIPYAHDINPYMPSLSLNGTAVLSVSQAILMNPH
jgi:alcohol dehydrogenase (NADP+)